MEARVRDRSLEAEMMIVHIDQAKYLRRVSRATGRPVPVMADPGYGEADISDAEIERRYQAALVQIRRRA